MNIGGVSVRGLLMNVEEYGIERSIEQWRSIA